MPFGDCTGPWWAQNGNNPQRQGLFGWIRGFFGRGRRFRANNPDFSGPMTNRPGQGYGAGKGFNAAGGRKGRAGRGRGW